MPERSNADVMKILQEQQKKGLDDKKAGSDYSSQSGDKQVKTGHGTSQTTPPSNGDW